MKQDPVGVMCANRFVLVDFFSCWLGRSKLLGCELAMWDVMGKELRTACRDQGGFSSQPYGIYGRLYDLDFKETRIKVVEGGNCCCHICDMIAF